MIDKITIRVLEDEIDLDNIKGILYDKENNNKNTNKGCFRNFRFFKRGIYIFFQGSLTKYGLGTNSVNADKRNTFYFIRKLARELGINLQAEIYDLEFGFNIQVKENVSRYLSQMLYAQNYKSDYQYLQKERVFIQKSKKRIRVYDKSDHFRKAKGKINIPALGKINLMRYEIYMRHPQDILNQKDILKLSDLLHSETLDKFILLWYKEFKAITFKSNIRYAYEPLTPSNVLDHYALIGIEHSGGLNAVLTEISQIDFKNDKYGNRRKARMMASKIVENNILIELNPLRQELHEKILFISLHHTTIHIDSSLNELDAV